jgi:hypothetical protein
LLSHIQSNRLHHIISSFAANTILKTFSPASFVAQNRYYSASLLPVNHTADPIVDPLQLFCHLFTTPTNPPFVDTLQGKPARPSSTKAKADF